MSTHVAIADSEGSYALSVSMMARSFTFCSAIISMMKAIICFARPLDRNQKSHAIIE